MDNDNDDGNDDDNDDGDGDDNDGDNDDEWEGLGAVKPDSCLFSPCLRFYPQRTLTQCFSGFAFVLTILVFVSFSNISISNDLFKHLVYFILYRNFFIFMYFPSSFSCVLTCVALVCSQCVLTHNLCS